jgi:hypothetical protein
MVRQSAPRLAATISGCKDFRELRSFGTKTWTVQLRTLLAVGITTLTPLIAFDDQPVQNSQIELQNSQGA